MDSTIILIISLLVFFICGFYLIDRFQIEKPYLEESKRICDKLKILLSQFKTLKIFSRSTFAIDLIYGIFFVGELDSIYLFNIPPKGSKKEYSITKIRLSSIRCVEHIINNESVQKTDRGAQLIGLTAGAIIGGALGATIGGLTAQNISSANIKKITVRIYTNDISSPVYDLVFYDNNYMNPRPLLSEFELNNKKEAIYNESISWYGTIQAFINNDVSSIILNEEKIHDIDNKIIETCESKLYSKSSTSNI